MRNHNKIRAFACGAALSVLLLGCAADKAFTQAVVDEKPQCKVGSTLACKERHGKTVSCSCTSKDALMQVLYPQGVYPDE